MERTIEESVFGHDTFDGDGVSLKRILSLPHVRKFDPFLMLDSFGSDSTIPGPGFPWHPHRGIITISYMIAGEIEHQDSLGNHGRIGPGGVQWMKAASGIIHQEMPHPGPSGIRGLQFWLNIETDDKMSDPDYGDISADQIPVVSQESVTVAVIVGSLFGQTGPVTFPRTLPVMAVLTFHSAGTVTIPCDMEKNFFVVGISGEPNIGTASITPHAAHLLSSGSSVTIESQSPAQCMLVGAVPLGEPIAWNGPIVMNTGAELELAFREFREGTFVKKGKHP